MTWKDLAKQISKMTEEELNQDVRFLEPYDDASGYPVQIGRADIDKYTTDQDPDDEQQDPFVKEGEFYLW